MEKTIVSCISWHPIKFDRMCSEHRVHELLARPLRHSCAELASDVALVMRAILDVCLMTSLLALLLSTASTQSSIAMSLVIRGLAMSPFRKMDAPMLCSWVSPPIRTPYSSSPNRDSDCPTPKLQRELSTTTLNAQRALNIEQGGRSWWRVC